MNQFFSKIHDFHKQWNFLNKNWPDFQKNTQDIPNQWSFSNFFRKKKNHTVATYLHKQIKECLYWFQVFTYMKTFFS